MKTALLAISFFVAALAAADADAHGPRGRVHLGIHLGAPWYPFWYHPWYPAPYYSESVAVQRSEPPVYVERDEPAAAPPQAWWYYCDQSRGYYPYVQTCPGGWKKVPPAPRPAD
jgi:hypothetical protein